uniref:F-box domain-containing protein n=1 Tax=Arundo donax TaxID=35708 RepID=A0A0A9H2D6_ARUDO
MADNEVNHAANEAVENGVGHAAANGAVENGGDHAAAAALANGGGPDLAPAVAAANGGNHALAHPAAAVANGGGAMGNGGAVAPALRLRLIPDAALYQVLLRMPAAMVARFRAACRRWRDLTSTEAFRRDHHLHRSARPTSLFFYRLDHQAVPLDDGVVRVHLRAVDVHRRESFPVFRFAHHDPALPIVDPRVFRIEGSCDGILLLSNDARLYACNPCTRRWARLPPLHRLGDIVGFYARDLCGGREYRVLYHAGRDEEDCRYSILSFPEHGVRHIGRPTNLEAINFVLAGGICPSFEMPPIMVRDCLHWRPQVFQDNSYLLVFDTADELFRWIPPPRVLDHHGLIQVEGEQLLEINGMLAMIVVSPMSVGMWVLRDYMRQIWVFEYRFELPVGAIVDSHGYDEEAALSAAVFVVSEERNALVQCTHAMLQCDALATVLQTYQLAHNFTILSGYMLQESLLLHAFLPLRPSDVNEGDPPFFQGP